MTPNQYKQQQYQQRKQAERWGRWAELWVIMLMMMRGYRLIKWRYRCPHGEVDIIVKRGNSLRFVEVKYRRQFSLDMLDQILPNPTAKMRIKRSADLFITSQYRDTIVDVHLDAVIISRLGQTYWFWDAL